MTSETGSNPSQGDERSNRMEESLSQLKSGRDALDRVITTIGSKLPPPMLQRMIRLRDLNDVVYEFLTTHSLLYNDLITKMPPHDDDSQEQARRREFFRTAFTYFEGTIYMMKQYALKAAPVFNVSLSEEEIAVISERQARLDNRGKPETAVWYPDTKANVRFAFSILAHCHNKDFGLDASGQAWEDFRTSHAVRNRLTHPKSRLSLEVTDDEILTLGRTSIWFLDQISQISKICVEAINESREEYTRSDQIIMQKLIGGVQESMNRALRTEQVMKLLEELRAQVGDTSWDERINEAQAELGTLKQYFVSQISPSNNETTI